MWCTGKLASKLGIPTLFFTLFSDRIPCFQSHIPSLLKCVCGCVYSVFPHLFEYL